jgi:hypothetical protein
MEYEIAQLRNSGEFFFQINDCQSHRLLHFLHCLKEVFIVGRMRFKQEPISELDAALDLYTQKLAGTDTKKLKHNDLTEQEQSQLLGDNWLQPLFAKYQQALKNGKVEIRH